MYVLDFGVASIFVHEPRGSNIAHGRIVPKGSDIDFKCAAFESKTQRPLHMYLCKNGIGIRMESFKGKEAHFTLKNVKREDSGSYSCVYSIKKKSINIVTSSKKNSMIIQVIGNDRQFKIHPACHSKPWCNFILYIYIRLVIEFNNF